MNALIDKLHNICKEYPLKEKILIVDTHSIGQEIKQAYINEHGYMIHLKTKTVHDLAVDVMNQKANHVFPLIEQSVGTQFIYHILKDLNENKELSYFLGLEVTSSFSSSIYQSINQLRLAGYTKDTLKKEAFISSAKADDLQRIMNRYEEALRQYQFIDEAHLFREASNLARTQNNAVFIMQSNLTLTQLSHDFLQQFLSKNVFKLPLPAVYGVSIPEHEEKDLRSIEWSAPTAFSYLYHLEELPKKPNITLFTAKTEEVEIKQVLQQIKQSEAALDDTVIFYPKAEPYITTIYQLSEKYQIPVTFEDGLSILYSQPGRLVAGLIKWLKEDYNVRTFIEMMNEGLIELPEEAPSKSKISKYLRDAKVGWSQSRYSRQLEQLKIQMQQKQIKAENEELQEYYQKQVKDITWLKTWFQRLFRNLPIVGLELNYQDVLQGISTMVKKHAKTTSILDELAKEELLEQMDVILPYANETLRPFEAFQKVRELLFMLRVHKSGPKPGYLHIGSYHNGIYNNRKNVFIVGLDNRAFPGAPNEDPLILDKERKQLNEFMPILQEKGNNNLFTMLQLLAQTQGKVSFSYCTFSINDNRTVNPAHIFLQGYRMIMENPSADFEELAKLESPLTSPATFEAKDYWNQLLEKDANIHLEQELLNSYQNLAFGEEAEEARIEGEFTHFDGKVNIDRHLFDPRQNEELVLSSGRLERLATCPYSYFLENILKLKPIEETEFDPYSWLDAPTRGSLLHSIFESFYKTLDGEKPAYKKHLETILTIAKEKIEEQKAIQPAPSERVLEREVNDIYQCCRIFLKEEESYSEGYQAKHFEHAFGLNGAEPAKITLPAGETIQVRGIVDRVDQSNDGHFHIIDYKTGSTYNYHDKNQFRGGRQLQHFIYALAIEEHLKLEAGTVKESSYYFPSVKGLGERYVRNQDNVLRTNGLDILEKLIDVIKHGHFSMTDNANDCTFCDFKAVCRREFYPQETLEQKQMDSHAEGVQKFKGVRAYE